MDHCLYNVHYTVLCSSFQNIHVNTLCEEKNLMHNRLLKNQFKYWVCLRVCIIKPDKPDTWKSKTDYGTIIVHSLVNLPLLQALSVYPGLHPLSQCPVRLLHEKLFRQWPLQLLEQLYPYVPSTHAVTDIDLRYDFFTISISN